MTLLSFVAVSALGGCGQGASDPSPSEQGSSAANVGSVALDLTLAAGVSIKTVSYDISKGSFDKPGTVDVSSSSGVSTIVDGIPFGTGYSVTMMATSTAESPPVNCMGSASFDVTTTAATAVPVHLACLVGAAAPATSPVPVPPGVWIAFCGSLLAAGFGLMGRAVPSKEAP